MSDCHIQCYGGGCKVSPGALEHCYGIVVVMLRQPRSIAPAALEKVYGGSCNLRFACVQRAFRGLWLGSRQIVPFCRGPQQSLGNGRREGGLPVKSMAQAGFPEAGNIGNRVQKVLIEPCWATLLSRIWE